MKKSVLLIVLMLALSLSLISCSSENNDSSDSTAGAQNQTASASAKGLAVPDLDGNMYDMDQFAGKPLIINFWGTWCPPCRREMPDLQKIYNEYSPQGLEIIGLAVNDTPDKVKNFIGKYGYNWTMLIATREAMRHYKLGTGVPLTIFYDKEGNEVERYIGMRTYNDFKAQVEKII
jgi:thiol-disulfide isomerase/thioredoxin